MEYLILRVHEMLDPRAVYGRPWLELTREEQVNLLGYVSLRNAEEAGAFEK